MTLRRVPEIIERKDVWEGVSWLSGLVGALVVKKLLRVSYRSIRHADPATAFDPAKAGFSWPEALLWAAAAGIGLVIARIVSARVAAIGWEVATGDRPPGAVGDEAVG